MAGEKSALTSCGVEGFLNFLRETEQAYKMAQANEDEANRETQDILHAVELDASSQKPAQLLRKLKRVRQKRRAAKDTIAAAEPVVKWYGDNQSVVKALERLLGEVRKQEKKTQNRVYVPRTGILRNTGGNGGGETG